VSEGINEYKQPAQIFAACSTCAVCTCPGVETYFREYTLFGSGHVRDGAERSLRWLCWRVHLRWKVSIEGECSIRVGRRFQGKPFHFSYRQHPRCKHRIFLLQRPSNLRNTHHSKWAFFCCQFLATVKFSAGSPVLGYVHRINN
jgi:hypothetical protein